MVYALACKKPMRAWMVAIENYYSIINTVKQKHWYVYVLAF